MPSIFKLFLKNIEKPVSGWNKGDRTAVDVNVLGDQASNLDGFSRLRVAEPVTLFDSKQLHDKQPLFWDDQETSGAGTSSTYKTNQAATELAVSNLTAGTRVRQTFQRFNYQPGKSQTFIMTGVLGDAASGITQRIGYFDQKNGIFFECKNAELRVVCRSYTTGSAVDTPAAQSTWNIDKLDGTGDSGITLDLTKTQIFFADFEWLGVGRIRFGFFLQGKPVYCHEFLNSNVITKVYMSTPNLPLRYEISNDGTGPASELLHICGTVISEGGLQETGILRHYDSAQISGLSNGGTIYAMLGIRLKSTHLDIGVLMETISIFATTTNDNAHWSLIWNPTVAGTFTYADVANSGVQIAQGAVGNTVTGGTEIDGGYFTTTLPTTEKAKNALKLGSKIDGTQDEIVLIARPITNNITVEASMTWRELS